MKKTKRSLKRQKDLTVKLALPVPDSSSSSSSSSQIISSTPSSVADENEAVLFKTFFEFSDESDSELEQSDHTLKSILFEDNFNYFDNFEPLPDIENISEDKSIYSLKVPAVAEKPKKVRYNDLGKFVDPLTGLEQEEELKYSSSTGSSEVATVEIHPVESEFSWDSLGSEPSTGTIGGEELKTVHVEDTKQDDDYLFEMLLNVSEQKSVITEEFDLEAIHRDQLAIQLRQQTEHFLIDIINAVVIKAELSSPEKFLRTRLDKYQLIAALFHNYNNYSQEKFLNSNLNRKLVEHYKRKKSYRQITEEKGKNISQDKRKYLLALNELDYNLAKQKNISHLCIQTIEKVSRELKVEKTKAEDIEKMLDATINKTLCKDEYSHLNYVIAAQLKKLAKSRAEISNVRYEMILTQHTYANLLGKQASFEDLGKGLTVQVYNQIKQETQTLGKKIEERNIELKKLHERMRNNLHMLSHYKQKQNILRDLIKRKSTIFEDHLSECTDLRKHVFDLKLERTGIRKQIKDLNLEDSLINKPALMYDYDKTINICNKKRELVSQLRLTFRTLTQKIKKLEECEGRKISYINTSVIV